MPIINSNTAVECFVNDFTVVQIFDFRSHESRSLTWFNVKEFHHAPNVAIHLEAEAV